MARKKERVKPCRASVKTDEARQNETVIMQSQDDPGQDEPALVESLQSRRKNKNMPRKVNSHSQPSHVVILETDEERQDQTEKMVAPSRAKPTRDEPRCAIWRR